MLGNWELKWCVSSLGFVCLCTCPLWPRPHVFYLSKPGPWHFLCFFWMWERRITMFLFHCCAQSWVLCEGLSFDKITWPVVIFVIYGLICLVLMQLIQSCGYKARTSPHFTTKSVTSKVRIKTGACCNFFPVSVFLFASCSTVAKEELFAV